METSVDVALGRVALLLRLIGAMWMVLLVAVYGAVGDLDVPLRTTAVTAGAVAWAGVAWRAGWIDRLRGPAGAVLAAELVVTSLVILLPPLLGEEAGVTGGYPFAALLVGLARGGRRGVVVAAAVLCAATLASLGAVGRGSLPSVVGNLLLYVLGAAALAVGIEVIRATERRVRDAQAALAVAEERAATAAHLHDSVLQTLALVQRRADDAGAVRSLARRQERELREWLFPAAGPPPGSPGSPGSPGTSAAPPGGDVGGGRSLGSLLASSAEEVEERHGVAVAVVVTGGAGGLPVGGDDRRGLGSLVLAAREAMANAAVHAGVPAVDVFAEVDGDEVVAYVRDRGRGFDPQRIPADRQGVRGSIIGRMARAGGRAEVRSTPGRGTEVRLAVPHSAVAAGTTTGDGGQR